jgi:hypothetical protein
VFTPFRVKVRFRVPNKRQPSSCTLRNTECTLRRSSSRARKSTTLRRVDGSSCQVRMCLRANKLPFMVLSNPSTWKSSQSIQSVQSISKGRRCRCQREARNPNTLIRDRIVVPVESGKTAVRREHLKFILSSDLPIPSIQSCQRLAPRLRRTWKARL